MSPNRTIPACTSPVAHNYDKMKSVVEEVLNCTKAQKKGKILQFSKFHADHTFQNLAFIFGNVIFIVESNNIAKFSNQIPKFMIFMQFPIM